MKKRKFGLKFMVKLMTAVVLLTAVGGTTISYALIDETNSVHIDASEIEDATLIIGTHLIYLGSMNDQIYESAMKSAEESNQYNRYYKSEIAGGIWYDITEAGALADITTDGIVVEDKVIEALNMTHHTKSDGITYDLRNNAIISVFDINDPYDLEEMTELDPIKLQYDTLVQMEDPSDTIERDIKYIKEIYKFDRSTDVTRELDKKMDALQAYYNILVRDGADEVMSDMVMSVIEKLDAARRVEVLGPLNDYQLQKMSQVIAREFTYLEGEITGVYTIAEEREKKAAEAAESAKEEVTKAEYLVISGLKSELSKLEAELEKEVREATEEVKEEWEPKIAAETDEVEKAKLVEKMNNAINEAVKEASEKYEDSIEDKRATISSLEDSVDEKVSEAAEEAAEEVMNADREVVENFVANTDLITAVGEAMANVQESYTNYSSKMLAEGATVLSKAEYRFSNELISNAQGQNYSGCDTAVRKLIYLDRINNSIIREETEERDFIAQELLEEARKNYSSSLGAGAGETYQTLSSMAAASTRANVLKNQLNETEITRNELQFIMQAYIDRMTSENAMDYITQCMDDIGSFRGKIIGDAYEAYANTSVDSHLEWLTRTLKNLQDLSGDSELDNLNQQKNDLQTELMTALDNNRLDQAKKIEAQIEAVDKEIDDTENYLNNVLNSDNASDSEKALAAAQLGEGSASAALQDLKNEALEEIRNGNLDGVGNLLDGIGALAAAQPEGALGALKDVYLELSNQELMGEDSSNLDELMSQVEDITAEQMENFTGDLSENDLSALIQAFVNENMDGNLEDGQNLDEVMSQLGSEQMASILAGLSMYTEQYGSKDLTEVLEAYSKIAVNDGNNYVYEQLKNEIFEFIPTDKLSRIIGYRYIFNDSQKAVTLQKGSGYYQFQAFSMTAGKGNAVEEMTKAAAFQSVIYIPEDTAQEYFALMAEYLHKTSYGVILTEEMNQQALAFVDYILEAGGEF